MKKTAREVRAGLDVSAVEPFTWRLFAECADEVTDIILIGEQWTPMMSDPDLLSGALGRALLVEHQSRCIACQCDLSLSFARSDATGLVS